MKLRRVFLVLLVLCLTLGAMVICSSATDIVASGRCGDNVYWERDSEGTLTISGEGDMWDWTWDYSPSWSYSVEVINTVVVEDGVTSIGAYAFNGCTNLTSVKIPDSITSIGVNAFYYSLHIADVYITDIQAWWKISFGNSYASPVYLDSTMHILDEDGNEITKLVLDDSVKTIPDTAFQCCRNLTSVTIPNGVASIGDWAFLYCTNLSSITIPDSVNSIGVYAFKYCSNLTSITIPNGVASIKEGAFSGCTALTKIAIPDSVIDLGAYAFSGCRGLTSIALPCSITNIGTDTFSDCTGLTSLTIPSSVISIGKYAFSGCTGLTSITIPNGVTDLGAYAFSGCTGLTSITVPNGVTSIGDYAFADCSNLKNVKLPYSLTAVGQAIFKYCENLTSATIPGNLNNVHSSIFLYCFNLTDITISEGSTDIGYYAFEDCTSLTSITIPDSVTSIEEGAFSGCKNLSEVTIPSSVTYIGEYAFSGCTNLIDITIPNIITRIKEGTFSGCASLTNVTIPNSVTSIGDGAFVNCTSLTSVTIPNSVTSIGERAFSSCTSLTSVTISNCVTSIGDSAFRDCTDLTSIELPASVTSIGNLVFSGCTNLSRVVFLGEAPSMGDNVFYGNHSTIYYPADDSTWRYTVGNSYGGYINWVSRLPLKITTQPKTTYTRSGANTNVSVEAQGTDLTYTWYYKNANGTKFSKSSITTPTYSVKMGNNSYKDRYVYCVITDVLGYTIQTNTVRLRMAATITKQPTSTKVVEGKTATVQLTAVGDGLTYTWYQAAPGSSTFTKTSTFTGNTYSVEMTAARDGRQVYCVVTDTYGKTMKSNTVTLGILEPPTITTQPKTTYTKRGNTAKATVEAEGEGLTYQWYYKNAGDTKYTKSSQTTKTYSIKMSSTTKDRIVYCVVTNKYGASVQTNKVTLRMAATITKQPLDTSAAKGNVAKPALTAVGDGLTYTWYYKDPGKTSYKVSTNKGNSCPTSMTATRDGRLVYCVVTDKYGNTAKSDVVKLGIPVQITQQPVTAYARNGAKAKTSVTATGHALTYTWYYKNAGDTKYSKSSITSSTYSVTMSSKYKDRYVYCVITDQFGNQVETNRVRLRMAASITNQPDDVMVAKGLKAKATVTAIGDGLTYKWYYKDVNSTKYTLSSVTGKTYSTTMSAAKDGRKVYCVVTDKYGKTVKSNVATLYME